MEKQIVKGAGLVGVLTLASRILGFVRDGAIAWVLGAGPLSDAFFVAFRVPNLLRKFLSEGVLSLTFVPAFSREHPRESGSFETARSTLVLVTFSALVLVAAGVIFAPGWVWMLAPGLSPEIHDQAVFFSRIMMPYLFWVLLLAVVMGILNSRDHFGAPAASPALLNLVILSFVLVVSPRVSSPGVAVSLGVCVGGFFQLMLQLPFLRSRGFRFFGAWRLFHPGALNALKKMFPAVVGAAGFHINLLTATLMASFLGQGSISYLYYADRLLQFPLALVGVSLSVAALPKFSSLLAAGERRGTASLFARGISGIVWVMVPATAGLIVLREPIVSLLFFQGAFEPAGVRETASALLFFCPGLCAMAGTRFFITLYCAGRETDVPFRAGLWAVLVNGLIAWPLMKLMDHQGLALGISISSWLNLVMLVRGVGQMMGPVSGRALCLDMTLFACRSLCASVIMAMIVQSFFNVLGLSPFSGKVALFLGVAGCVILGVIVYTGLFFLMGRFLAFIFKGEAE